MEKPAQDTKEAEISALAPLEIDCLKEIITEEAYGGLNVDQIKSKLLNQLLDNEKQAIYEISEIDESLRDMRGKLDNLDDEFKELETIIENQTNEYLSVIGDLSNFETQSKIVDTRLNNYQRLKETLQMLIGETDFTQEEIEALTNPDFENPSALEATLAILTKIGKYISNSNRFHENKFIVSKNQEFTQYVNTFEAKRIISKLREYTKKLSKKAMKYQSDKGNQEELSIVDTSFFRKSVIGLKPIYYQLFIIHDYDDSYFKALLKDFGAQIAEYTASVLGAFEKKWKATLSTFNIFKKKWNITSEMEINVENLNENQSRELKLTSFFENIIGSFDEQLESDENFWSKFFSFDDRKLTKESNEIKYFLTSIYTLPKQKLVELLSSAKKLSSISTFFVLAEVKKVIVMKQEDEGQSIFKHTEASYSYSTMTEIFTELNNQNNIFAQEQIKLLEEYKPEVNKEDVLLPIRNFTALSITIYEIFSKTNKDIFLLNVKQIYDAISAWLFKIAQAYPQVKDIIVIENSYYMYSRFAKISDPKYAEIANEMKDIFERHSKVYAKSVFTKTFATFSGYWFKIKEISEQTDISTVQLSGPYSKTSFLKGLKTTFSSISAGVDQMLLRISKELSKEAGLIRIEYDKLTEYLVKEYEEIEKFALKAYNERINPSKAEIQAVMLEKRP